MVTPDHLCPWGVKAKDLLKRNGHEVEDHNLESKDANVAYRKEHGYNETPQISIEGKHLGGYDALREHLGLKPDPKERKTYQPVVHACWTYFGHPMSSVPLHGPMVNPLCSISYPKSPRSCRSLFTPHRCQPTTGYFIACGTLTQWIARKSPGDSWSLR